ncbi:transposase, partial [Bacillus subtilis]|uniref:transposase n=1 Tax=Bacillus subtilis TaxID=1423 RepID=UPI002DBDB1F1
MVSVGKLKRDPNSVELANKIIEQYQPKSVEDMQEALKDIFGPMFESMLKGEMNKHLGYESNDTGEKERRNRRNRYGKKIVKTTAGEVQIAVHRDR